jgi:hypothetical protein
LGKISLGQRVHISTSICTRKSIFKHSYFVLLLVENLVSDIEDLPFWGEEWGPCSSG